MLQSNCSHKFNGNASTRNGAWQKMQKLCLYNQGCAAFHKENKRRSQKKLYSSIPYQAIRPYSGNLTIFRVTLDVSAANQIVGKPAEHQCQPCDREWLL